jgi:hypothetical protein
MRWGLAESNLDLPLPFRLVERRLAGLALDAWVASGRQRVMGFEAHSLIVNDPAGAQIIDRVGAAFAQRFGLVAGAMLGRNTGLASELSAACDLIALLPRPVPFESSLIDAAGCVLLRGVALPVDEGRSVQVVANWRDVLNRAATRLLQRELTQSLRLSGQKKAFSDPFS